MFRQQKQSNNDIMRYAGLGAQIFVSLGLAVFAGYKLDKWFRLSLPLLIWLLPVIVLCMMIYRLVKDTSKPNSDNEPRKS